MQSSDQIISLVLIDNNTNKPNYKTKSNCNHFTTGVTWLVITDVGSESSVHFLRDQSCFFSRYFGDK